MMQCVFLDYNLTNEVVLDGNWLDELPISNLCVKYLKIMYLQMNSGVTEEMNFRKYQRNDK